MNQYKKFLGRTDLVKNQVEREKLAEQEATSKRKRSIQQQNKQRWLKYQEQLRSELAARYFHSVMSTGGESFSNTRSLLFDKTDDRVATDIDIDATNGVTVSMWVKAPDSGTAGGWILSRGSTGGSNSTLNFDIKADGRLFHRIFGSSTYTGVNQLMDGNWHHIIILINYSANNITFFKDGTSSGNTLGHGSSYSTINLKSLGNAASNYYGGFVDEFAIFKSVLSESNIESLYNDGKPNDISSLSPFLWWRFEEGSGTTATDLGSGGNDGTIVGGPIFSTDVPE